MAELFGVQKGGRVSVETMFLRRLVSKLQNPAGLVKVTLLKVVFKNIKKSSTNLHDTLLFTPVIIRIALFCRAK